MFDAPSISITSRDEPFVISTQLEQVPQGQSVGPFAQFKAFAKILADEVFPHPRGPENK